MGNSIEQAMRAQRDRRGTKNRRGDLSERGVREESFFLRSSDGKSIPPLRSEPDRATPTPARATPRVAPDTANVAIPAQRVSRSVAQISLNPPAEMQRGTRGRPGEGSDGDIN